VSCISVTVRHGACVFVGGSFDPAYVLTVSALPPLVQPATNKRNAALIQKHMEQALRVPSTRGIVRFVPVQEENVAWGGKTVAGRIDELEKCLSGQQGQVLERERPQRQHQHQQQMRSQDRRVEDEEKGLPALPADRVEGMGGNGKGQARKALSIKVGQALQRLSSVAELTPTDCDSPLDLFGS
jgi:hypothetical protein